MYINSSVDWRIIDKYIKINRVKKVYLFTLFFMNKNIICLVILLLVWALCFFAWMEYKSYQVRTAIQEWFKNTFWENKEAIKTEEKKESVRIDKNIWDKIILNTVELIVNKSEEKTNLEPSFWDKTITPKQWAKFIKLEVNVKNITQNPFYDSFEDLFLQDSAWNNYSAKSCAWEIKDCISRDFQPWIEEKWNIFYEVPETATSFYLTVWKWGTNETYFIKL